jgi:1-acyl-sn-glycerol-3-phosphate acyltransferase
MSTKREKPRLGTDRQEDSDVGKSVYGNDTVKGILLFLIRPFVGLWMRFDAKRIVRTDGNVDFKRKEPYVMLANHTFLFDVIHVPLPFSKVPYIVGSQTLFTKQPVKFLVSKVARVIAKSKGASDISTVKSLLAVVRKGYPILIFPEGDTTFFGRTNLIEPSTYKLVKKLGVDVITANVKGGYLSKPRWALFKRKKRVAEFDYSLLITKDEIKDMDVETIQDRIERALDHDDYSYQREVMRPHPGKRLAEGIENVCYVCPVCKAVTSIETQGNTMTCTSCKTTGHVDDYGFIRGFPYDNLIEWDAFQRVQQKTLMESTVKTSATMTWLDMDSFRRIPVGRVDILYKDGKLHLGGAHEETIDIRDTSNATITLRRDLGFVHQDKTYFLSVDRFGHALLRILQNKY